MITSKELLERTGISRATLNNYVALGILPTPSVRKPTAPRERARRLGYFPDDAVERIETVRRLKAEGLSIDEIADRFRGYSPAADHVVRGRGQEATGDQSVIMPLCVVIAELENAARIHAELLAEDYIDLIDEIAGTAEQTFRSHHGVHCNLTAERFVAYFLPQHSPSYLFDALQCAHALREAMRRICDEWQRRKSWTSKLRLNIGLNAAEDWLADVRSPSGAAFTVLGDAANTAAKLSRLAENGAIWATKILLAKLSGEERKRVRFGIRRSRAGGHETLIPQTFSRICDLIDPGDPKFDFVRDIPTLAVAEVLEVKSAESTIESRGRN